MPWPPHGSRRPACLACTPPYLHVCPPPLLHRHPLRQFSAPTPPRPTHACVQLSSEPREGFALARSVGGWRRQTSIPPHATAPRRSTATTHTSLAPALSHIAPFAPWIPSNRLLYIPVALPSSTATHVIGYGTESCCTAPSTRHPYTWSAPQATTRATRHTTQAPRAQPTPNDRSPVKLSSFTLPPSVNTAPSVIAPPDTPFPASALLHTRRSRLQRSSAHAAHGFGCQCSSTHAAHGFEELSVLGQVECGQDVLQLLQVLCVARDQRGQVDVLNALGLGGASR